MKNQRNSREILWFGGEFSFFDSYDFWSGQWIDGFNLFIEMRRAGVDIVDPFILSSIVGASTNLAALELGEQIHCLVLSLGYEYSLFVSNALVDMDAKCSDILATKTIFDTMCRRDIVSWTSIIVGMAQHGRANESLSLHDKYYGDPGRFRQIITNLMDNSIKKIMMLDVDVDVADACHDLILLGINISKSMKLETQTL
ncbi:pentatricopeptide repeat-containing protein At4g14050, mitochondrial-like [Camellia sinensis]|uniref:pentatricopeptide repeat-containing protein At4g14050, mitochondrial-like n=1 Tax=Camellia sinensis TaxID=4442 RepID=UPI0010368442|nr:pentatricopeptide repeat-containing protein At4g14050, mitochondrial-like [Camellia sinensis]